MIHGKKSSGKTGFTLIELLVVIAVIAILAAMLLPALARSKAQARSTVCKNHLHEMGMAMQMYVDDTKFYPYGAIFNPDFSQQDGLGPLVFYWYAVLQPYYSLNWTNPAYHCPAYSGSILGGLYGSYSYNVFGATEWDIPWGGGLGLGIGWLDLTPPPPHSDAQIVAPSETFALMDAQEVVPYSPSIQDYIGRGWSGLPSTECNGLYSQKSGFTDVASYTNQGSCFPIPHGRLFNVIYCDGHISAIPASLLFNLTNSAANWNVDHQPHPEFWMAFY